MPDSRTLPLIAACLGMLLFTALPAAATELIAWGSPVVGDNGRSSTRARINWDETLSALEDLDIGAYVVMTDVTEDPSNPGNYLPETQDLQDALAAVALRNSSVQIIASVDSYGGMRQKFASMATHDDWLSAMSDLATSTSGTSLNSLKTTYGAQLRGVVVHENHDALRLPIATTGGDYLDSADLDALQGFFDPLEFYLYVPGDHRLIQHVLGGYIMGAKQTAVSTGDEVTATLNFTMPATASKFNGHVAFWYQDSTLIAPSHMDVRVELEDVTGSKTYPLHSPAPPDGAQPIRHYSGDMTPYLTAGNEYNLVVTVEFTSGRKWGDYGYLLYAMHDFEVVLSYTTDVSPPSPHFFDAGDLVGGGPSTITWVSEETDDYEHDPAVADYDGLWILQLTSDGQDDAHIAYNYTEVGDMIGQVDQVASDEGWSLETELMVRVVDWNKFSSTGWYSWDPTGFSNLLTDLEGVADEIVLFKAPISLEREGDGIFSAVQSPPSDSFRPWFVKNGHRIPGWYQELVSPYYADVSAEIDSVWFWDEWDSTAGSGTAINHQVLVRDSSGADTVVAETTGAWDEGSWDLASGYACTSPAVDPEVGIDPSLTFYKCVGELASSLPSTDGYVVLRSQVLNGFGDGSSIEARFFPVCPDGGGGVQKCSLGGNSDPADDWTFGSDVLLESPDADFEDWPILVHDAIDSFQP